MWGVCLLASEKCDTNCRHVVLLLQHPVRGWFLCRVAGYSRFCVRQRQIACHFCFATRSDTIARIHKSNIPCSRDPTNGTTTQWIYIPHCSKVHVSVQENPIPLLPYQWDRPVVSIPTMVRLIVCIWIFLYTAPSKHYKHSTVASLRPVVFPLRYIETIWCVWGI